MRRAREPLISCFFNAAILLLYCCVVLIRRTASKPPNSCQLLLSGAPLSSSSPSPPFSFLGGSASARSLSSDLEVTCEKSVSHSPLFLNFPTHCLPALSPSRPSLQPPCPLRLPPPATPASLHHRPFHQQQAARGTCQNPDKRYP